ncbi:MAG: hypothetical protein AB1411_16500 [Nitrospirota bacterium]
MFEEELRWDNLLVAWRKRETCAVTDRRRRCEVIIAECQVRERRLHRVDGFALFMKGEAEDLLCVLGGPRTTTLAGSS